MALGRRSQRRRARGAGTVQRGTDPRRARVGARLASPRVTQASPLRRAGAGGGQRHEGSWAPPRGDSVEADGLLERMPGAEEDVLAELRPDQLEPNRKPVR